MKYFWTFKCNKTLLIATFSSLPEAEAEASTPPAGPVAFEVEPVGTLTDPILDPGHVSVSPESVTLASSNAIASAKISTM